MKRKILLLALLTICCVIMGTGTLAYFTDSVTAENIITSGKIDIELVETTDQKDSQGNPVLFTDVNGVMPGTSVSKIVQVKNHEDSAAAYIRVAVNKTMSGVSGTPDLNLVQIDFNTSKWTLKDGFYYYNEPLAPGAVTDSLFTKVTFHKSMDNKYQNSTLKIDVDVAATQVANNPCEYPWEAAGWPAMS